MPIKEGFFFLFIIGISACNYVTKCPIPRENLWPECDCSITVGGEEWRLECGNRKHIEGATIQDYIKVFKKNNLADHRNLKIYLFGLDNSSSIPSRVFEGYDITFLQFYGYRTGPLKKWADEEGGPAFVGLEDTLEEIVFFSVINAARKYSDYEQEKAPMSLGHLCKLRRVEFTFNGLNTFANGWFEKGPSSLEELKMKSCKTRYLGNRAFADLVNLKKIDISSNEIGKLSRTLFPNPANHLKEIDLSFNQLRVLPEDMFTNMPSLTEVSMNSNHLTHLQENVWRPVWSRLRNLYLLWNPLNCDDRISWMFDLEPPHIVAICEKPEDAFNQFLEEIIRKKQGKY